MGMLRGVVAGLGTGKERWRSWRQHSLRGRRREYENLEGVREVKTRPMSYEPMHAIIAACAGLHGRALCKGMLVRHVRHVRLSMQSTCRPVGPTMIPCSLRAL